MQDAAVGDGESLGSPRCRVAHALSVSRLYRTAGMLGVTVAIALGFPGSPSAREYRSREVTRQFQREHPCPSTENQTVLVQATGRIMLSRLPAADPMPSPTCNGRRSAMPGQRTGGSERCALASYLRAASHRSLPCRPRGSRTRNRPAARTNPITSSRHRSVEPVRRDRARPDGGNPGTM